MLRPGIVLALVALGQAPLQAAEYDVPARPGALVEALAKAEDGDVLRLAPGKHQGAVVVGRPLIIDGGGQAHLEGTGRGSVISVEAADVVIRGLRITGSGSSHETIDSGVKLGKQAVRAVVEGNRMVGNLYGVDIHGAQDARVVGNVIQGRQDHRMNARGNGIYVWNAPGAVVEGNDVRWGRDGIFANTSKKNVFRGNRFRDLRFAVHYMHTNDTEVSGNLSVGNHVGYALMFSHKVLARDNVSIGDRDHGIMLNYANSSEITGNLVVDGAGKCAFLYNANKNTVAGNRFEGCDIGIHFTAGSERNAITGNAFIANRTQVKYVGSRWLDWSAGGRGNHWSDHAAFDVDGDGIADTTYRPNDMMDHILWTQPAAKLLLGSPAVQLVHWSQSAFPALLPGGVLDSRPLMQPVKIAIPGWENRDDG